MNEITLDSGERFHCADDDTLLHAGLRAGLGLPYECSVGSCGTCKVELLEGEVDTLWADAPGLSDRDRRKGRILACQSRPRGACHLRTRLDPACVPAVIPSKRRARLLGHAPVTHDIRELRLVVDDAAHFLPGQYALLQVNEVQRAYSMANLPNAQGEWVFQPRQVPGGAMTGLLFNDQALEHAQINLDGPYGLAHLRDTGRDLVCVAGGSGLAPMLSIARGVAAAPQMAERQLYFFHGGRTNQDLLDAQWVREATGLGERLHYISAASQSDDGVPQGFIHEVVSRVLGEELARLELYCAGPPPMTQALEQMARGLGMAAEHIHYDRFF